MNEPPHSTMPYSLRPMPSTGAGMAGGQSRRMGTDKALLRLPSGGPTLIERVGAAARAVTGAET